MKNKVFFAYPEDDEDDYPEDPGDIISF